MGIAGIEDSEYLPDYAAILTQAWRWLEAVLGWSVRLLEMWPNLINQISVPINSGY